VSWNPQPPEGALHRTAYLAGYSDGFHGYHFGAGYDAPPPIYRTAYDQGRQDKEPADGQTQA
jgi:hypothetical protein